MNVLLPTPVEFVTTSPSGPSTVTGSWNATLDIVEAADRVLKARAAWKEAQWAEYEARQEVIAAEQAEQDARDRAVRCPGECPCLD